MEQGMRLRGRARQATLPCHAGSVKSNPKGTCAPKTWFIHS